MISISFTFQFTKKKEKYFQNFLLLLFVARSASSPPAVREVLTHQIVETSRSWPGKNHRAPSLVLLTT